MTAVKNVTVTKSSKDCRVGITFATNRNDELVISKIAPDGLFANSGLESNMYVLGINDAKDIKNMTPKQAAQLVKDAESTVTVRAVKRTKASSSAGSPTTSLATANMPRPPPSGCPEGGQW